MHGTTRSRIDSADAFEQLPTRRDLVKPTPAIAGTAEAEMQVPRHLLPCTLPAHRDLRQRSQLDHARAGNRVGTRRLLGVCVRPLADIIVRTAPEALRRHFADPFLSRFLLIPGTSIGARARARPR